jgi:hypothetical protein
MPCLHCNIPAGREEPRIPERFIEDGEKRTQH